MKLDEQFFLRKRNYGERLLSSFVALLALGIGVVNAATPLKEEKTVSIGISIPRDDTGNLILPQGEAFEIGITELFNQPIKIWEEKCQSGNRSLKFRVKIGDEAASIAQKRDVPKDVWIGQLGYLPRTRTLPPKASETRTVNFSEFFWGDRAWHNAPEPNSGEKVQIQACFEIAPDDEAKTNGLWIGKVESALLSVLVINPKLKTPHEYLWNGCPRQALRVMKNDPSWIKKTDDMQCTPLHHAARFGPKEVVVWLVENGANVEARCYNDFTPLYFAAAFNNLDILQYLIMKGAKVEGSSGMNSPLQAAAQNKNPEILRALLDAGANYDLDTAISRSDEAGVKAMLAKNPGLARRARILSTACGRGNVGIVSLLIENGADPNESGGMWKDSPLLWALSYPPIVKLLLEKGADPKIRLHINGLAFGSTLLHEAARKGELESARLLIDHGAEVDAIYVDQVFKRPAEESVFTPLHAAAAAGQPKLVQLLLDQKADLNRRTSSGQNALQLAGRGIRLADAEGKIDENRRYAEVVKILASRGLEIDLFTAVALEDREQVAAMLKAKPERVGEKDSEGSFPLHRAVGINQIQIAETLLAAGADVNDVGRSGRTPLIEAAFWGRLEMVRLLLKRGAKPDVTAEHGATALSEAERVLPHSARKQEYEEVIKLLKERTPR